MARPKKDPNSPKKVKKDDSDKSDIIKALEYVCINQKDEGNPGQTNCIFANGFVTTWDGVTALGYPIQGDLEACPQSKVLLTALKRAKGAYSLTQLDGSNLVLQAGKFRATVPCLPLETLAHGQPDTVCYGLTNEFRKALDAVGKVVSESANNFIGSSIYCRNQSVIATDKICLLEYWHGLPFPELCIPKQFSTMLNKIELNIVSFGFSSNSLTIYFENGAWIKTQTLQDTYPINNIEQLLNIECEAKPLPPAFKEALEIIQPFAEPRVYVGKEKIYSHLVENQGASIDFKSDQFGCFDVTKLLSVIDHVRTIDFRTNVDGKALFFGNSVRGLICQMSPS